MTSTNDSDIELPTLQEEPPIPHPSTQLAHLIESNNADKFFQYLANLPTDNQNSERQDAAITIANLLDNANDKLESNKFLEWMIFNLEQLASDYTLISKLTAFCLFTLDPHLQQLSFNEYSRQRLLTSLQALLSHRIAANPDDLLTASDLSVADNKLGDFYLFRRHLGDTERALASYSAGLKIRERLYQAHKKQPEFARDLSVSYEKLGDFYLQRNYTGDAELALAAYTASLELDKRLYRTNTKKLQAARDLSVIQNKLGDFYLQLGKKTNIKQALTAYTSSLKIRKLLHRSNRNNAQFAKDLLLSYNKFGDLYLQRQRRWDKWRALKAYKAGLELASGLYEKNQSDPDIAQNLAYCHNKLGSLYLNRGETGDVQRALAAYTTCSEILERLHQDNPQNFAAARNLAVIYNKLGFLYFHRNELEDAEQALSFFKAALEIATQLYQINPNLLQIASDLSIINNNLGDYYLRSGTPEDAELALSAYTASMEIRERLHKTYPNDVQVAKNLAISYWKMATASQTSPTKSQLWWDNCYRQFWDIEQQDKLAPHEQKYLQYAAQKASYSLDKPKLKLEHKSSPQSKDDVQAEIYPLRTTKRIIMALLVIFWITTVIGGAWLKAPQLVEAAGHRLYQTTATTLVPVLEQINRKLELQPMLDKTIKFSQDTWAAIPAIQIPDTVKNFTNSLNFNAMLDKAVITSKAVWDNAVITSKVIWNNAVINSKVIWDNAIITSQRIWAYVLTIKMPNYLDSRPYFNKLSKDLWKMLPTIPSIKSITNLLYPKPVVNKPNPVKPKLPPQMLRPNPVANKPGLLLPKQPLKILRPNPVANKPGLLLPKQPPKMLRPVPVKPIPPQPNFQNNKNDLIQPLNQNNRSPAP